MEWLLLVVKVAEEVPATIADMVPCGKKGRNSTPKQLILLKKMCIKHARGVFLGFIFLFNCVICCSHKLS
jgi:hypothetical protein